MPRPRVRIEDRQRAVRACLPCKASKKRCDAKTPCSSCIKRNCEHACTVHEGSRPSGVSMESPQAGQSRRLQQHSRNKSSLNGVSAWRESLPVDERFTTTDRNYSNEIAFPSEAQNDESSRAGDDMQIDENGNRNAPAEADLFPRSRLMLNANGEKVYFGKTASLAFLRFLRQILSQHMGPSQFTENTRGNVMLETRTPGDNSLDSEGNSEDKKVLIDGFFLASNGILDLFTKSDIVDFLGNEDNRSEDLNLNEGVLNLVLAIGRQCRVASPGSSNHSQSFFIRGQQKALGDMLENPSVSMIWSFLLMAFYLLGACRRNAAFMYLGVAARAAHALGLHESDQYSALSHREQNIRLRTWKSLRILDVITSSILARPLASVSTRPEISVSSSDNENSTSSSLATNANFDLCTIIESVLRHISQQHNLDCNATQTLLQKLSYWSTNLTPEIRLCSLGTSIRSTDHEKALGNIHVTCMYYFTVMLLTRPFLIRYLMSGLPSMADQHQSKREEASPPDVSKLAQVSIDAAVFTSQICHSALSAGLLLDNMCILKAWIFAAGLVLGFTLFANVEVEPNIENAFTGVRDVLKKLSHQSAQAEHYHDVLVSFSEAINRRRQQIAHERRLVTSKYLDQILVIDVRRDQNQSRTPQSTNTEDFSMETGSIENWWNSSLPFAPGILENPPDILRADWDAFAIHISEQLTYGNID